MAGKFNHLHVHSHYSLLQALPKIDDLISAVKAQGSDAVALTDNGVLYGAIEFYKAAKDAGIKPIIGMDAYVAPTDRFEKQPNSGALPWRLTLLAFNNDGYKNLIRLSSLGFLEGMHVHPCIDKELLKKYSGGLIALSGGRFGEIPVAANDGDIARAETLIKEYQNIFDADNFYIELVDMPEVAEQTAINSRLIELGKKLGVPLVATKDVYYIDPDDAEAWKIHQCIQKGINLEEYERVTQFDFDASLVSPDEMVLRFSDVPEAIENTRLIAERCNVELELGKWNFPAIIIPEGETMDGYLRKRAFAEIVNKVKEVNDEITERMNYELSIIEQKGFAPYFLVVSDYIAWARANGIVTTTRGSAAGSLVSYSIGISTINPLRFQLPFERFLNPERPSAPDIDADFADNRRDEIFKYVTEKYGEERVAQICTFGTMMARGSVRDVGRSLGYPYKFCDQISKMIPFGKQGFPMTIDRALNETDELRKLYDTNAQVNRLINLAKRIEGCARHVSIHAAGVVIAPTDLTDFTPLQIESKEGKIITQYDMNAVEAAGLLKMDFLGIRNLSILGDAVQLVKKMKGIEEDIECLPLDDKKTFDLLASGATMGVFQLGSDGMTKYLMDLQPSRVEDIMVMVALYRPGPIESIPEYIRRKHDASLVSYIDPRMKDIIDKSYGIIVYQDDVMLIAIKLAGYSWLEADKLRKAMGKKIPAEMAAQKEKLIKGFIKNGTSEEIAESLWRQIEPFAAYGFNKAHAASYGMVAYQTAYMKANYTTEYMTALLTNESDDLDKIAEAVRECRRLGIEVLPPDINESDVSFTCKSDTQIRFGLLAIKNIGEEIIASIINERNNNGKFVDISDMATRVSHRAFNKKSLEALIKAGALDCFGDRNLLLENTDQILQFNRDISKKSSVAQTSLFDGSGDFTAAKIRLRPVPKAALKDMLIWEKETLGLYVTSHPFAEYAKALEGKIIPCGKIKNIQDGKNLVTAGIISAVQRIITKKGEPMCFVQCEDMEGSVEIVVFPRTLKKFNELIAVDRVIKVNGTVSKKEGDEAKLIAQSFFDISQDEQNKDVSVPESASVQEEIAPQNHFQGLQVKLSNQVNGNTIDALRGILKEYPGNERVYFLVESAGRPRRIATDYWSDGSQDLINRLAEIVGENNIFRE